MTSDQKNLCMYHVCISTRIHSSSTAEPSLEQRSWSIKRGFFKLRASGVNHIYIHIYISIIDNLDRLNKQNFKSICRLKPSLWSHRIMARTLGQCEPRMMFEVDKFRLMTRVKKIKTQNSKKKKTRFIFFYVIEPKEESISDRNKENSSDVYMKSNKTLFMIFEVIDSLVRDWSK